MSDTCPVCGKGDREERPLHGQVFAVSHLACVENVYAANLSLRVLVQQAEAENERLKKWQAVARAVNPTVGEYCDERTLATAGSYERRRCEEVEDPKADRDHP